MGLCVARRVNIVLDKKGAGVKISPGNRRADGEGQDCVWQRKDFASDNMKSGRDCVWQWN